MKKLLIVGCGTYQLPLIEYALAVCHVLIAAPEIPRWILPRLHAWLSCDVTEKESILSFAQAHRINGVTTDQTDIAVRTVAYVAEQMGLPGIGYNTACLFTDKALMRKRLLAMGTSAIPFVQCRNETDAINFFLEQDARPVILKPVDNQGSRGIFVCHNETDIKNFFEASMSYSKTGTVIAEKYISGKEFVVEALSFNGYYEPLIWGDTQYFGITSIHAPCSRIFPSAQPAGFVQELLALDKQIITGFGLPQGISHSEYIADENGIYLIETAARGGGMFISSDLIPIGTGLDTQRFLVDIALGTLRNVPKILHKKKAFGYMAFLLPEGTVARADGIKEVQDLAFVHRNLLNDIHAGMRACAPRDKTSRYAITLEAEDRHQLVQRMQAIQETLHIQVSTQDGICDAVFGSADAVHTTGGGYKNIAIHFHAPKSIRFCGGMVA